MKKIIPVLFSVFLLSGCFGIHPLEEPTLVSTRNYEFTNKIYCIEVERVSSQMAGRVCFCSTWQANQNPKAEAV